MKHALLDYLINAMDLKNDADLSRQLRLSPPVICKIRNGTLPLAPGFILKAHEMFDIPIRTLKGVAEMECLPVGGRVR